MHQQEILVYDEGDWAHDENLYKAIQRSSLEQLVLEPSMKFELVRDFEQFFSAEALYASMNIPWKRGVLLVTLRAMARPIS